MRTNEPSRSALRVPLNELLGAEANVRMLRLLSATAEPMSKAAIARATGLNAAGVGRIVERLVEHGIIEPLGVGSRRLYRFRGAHPLAGPLRNLFAAERARFDVLVDDLRAAVLRLKPPPRAAWIQGPAARGADRPGDPVVIGLLASARDVDGLADRLQSRAMKPGSKHDVMIDVRGLTGADVATMSSAQRVELEAALPLLGPPPLSLLQGNGDHGEPPPAPRHKHVDRRLRETARAIADKLRDDSTLIERAGEYIRRRLPRASAAERRVLEEWDEVLDSTTPARLSKLLVERSERAARLRQSLPFVDALTAEERAVLRRVGHDAG